jgi:hypothetical protein
LFSALNAMKPLRGHGKANRREGGMDGNTLSESLGLGLTLPLAFAMILASSSWQKTN